MIIWGFQDYHACFKGFQGPVDTIEMYKPKTD